MKAIDRLVAFIKKRYDTGEVFNNFVDNLKQEEKKLNLYPEDCDIHFTLRNDTKPIMKISNRKFYWKDEEVEDIHNVYERFNEWLTKAEINTPKEEPLPNAKFLTVAEQFKDDPRMSIDPITGDVTIK